MKLKSGKKVSVLEEIKALDFEGRLSFDEEVKLEVDKALKRIQHIQKELGGIRGMLTSIQTKVGTISGVKLEAKRLMESLEESDLTYEATEGKVRQIMEMHEKNIVETTGLFMMEEILQYNKLLVG
uniref:Uncharacterized protein n=1 Tax=Branchiostoma floridae TaxID=7739 RepID=C3Y3D7_BRAFL|eukprot:XP_002609194.1 hypothetical protein BRAFLDRAFT_90647 [Branchiostoma floridae]